MTSFHDYPLIVSDTPGTTLFTYDGTAFSYLYAYVAGETASKAQYKITFNQIENYQPQINSSPIEIAKEDTEWTYTLQVSDANNDNLSYVIEKPEWVNWDEASKTLSGTPKQNNIGSESISITVNDGWGGSNVQKFDLAVLAVNDEPFTDNVKFKGNFVSGEGVELDLESLSDADGLGNISVIWQSDGQNIKDASGTKLFLSDDLVGTIISAKVSYRDAYGTFEEFSVTSGEEVAPTPGEVVRQERVIGIEINSPDLAENQ